MASFGERERRSSLWPLNFTSNLTLELQSKNNRTHAIKTLNTYTTEVATVRVTDTRMADLDKLINDVLTQDSNSDDFTNAVASLASLSREQEAARNRLASQEVLQRLLQILSTEPKTVNQEEFFATILRCVGNACVSNPEACQTVTDHKFAWPKAFLQGFPCHWTASSEEDGLTFPMPAVSTRDLAVKVLYNICSQSEEAQKQCYHDNIHALVIEAMFDNQHFGGEVADDVLSLTVDLLLWITSHHKELASFEGETERKRGLAEPRSLKTEAWYWLVKSPLICMDRLDVDDWASLLETCLVFLREPSCHKGLIEWELVQVVWYILENNERKVEAIQDNEEDKKLLVALSTSLIWVLSDVAATPEFATAHAGASANVLALAAGFQDAPVLQQLVEHLSKIIGTGEVHSHDASGDRSTNLINDESLRLTTAACQVIGNLLHNLVPKTGTVPAAIQEEQLHKRLFNLMAVSDSADFLHSAAGLLIQLSRPSIEAREEIASDSNALNAIKRLGQHTMQELNQDALMLMRALGKDAPATQERLKELAGEVMATVAETQQAAASAQTGQPALEGTS
ncbi:hypothetical protein Q7P35_009417 [Cladosporium inversicolor]